LARRQYTKHKKSAKRQNVGLKVEIGMKFSARRKATDPMGRRLLLFSGENYNLNGLEKLHSLREQR
jgi:hypothetical protein